MNITINPKKIRLSDVVALDLETSGLYPWLASILVISITTDTTTYVLDARKYSKEYLTRLFEGLSEKLVVGQNIKFDSNFIYHHYGVSLPRVWDTMVVDQVLTTGLGYDYDLYTILNRNLGLTLSEDPTFKKYMQMSFVGLKSNQEITAEQFAYAASDTQYLLQLYRHQYSKVREIGLEEIVKLEHELLPVLVKMEVVGCRIDTVGWKENISKWEKERRNYVDLLDKELHKLSTTYEGLKKYNYNRKRKIAVVFDLFAGPSSQTLESDDSLNYASSNQILEVFRLINEPVPSVIDKETGVVKESAGEGVLKTYITEHPETKLKKFIELLLKFREYEKLLSTYGDSFLVKLDQRNYVHTGYSQAYTDTGRLASRNPNLQNIPGGKSDGSAIRAYFIPDEGDVMITADMEGAEARIAAAYSGEPSLVNSFLNDEDLHSKLASVSFSIIFGSKVTISKSKEPIVVGSHKFIPQELRDKHKSVLFAKFYKGGAKRIYEILAEYINLFQPDTAMDCAQAISKAIDKKLPKLSKYLTSLIDEAQSTGKLIANYLGRIRHFDKDVYGEAANYPIQGTNADAIKIAIIKINKELTAKKWGRVVMTIHDEVVCSVRKEVAEEAAKFIQDTMANALGQFLNNVVPGKSSVSISEHWQK